MKHVWLEIIAIVINFNIIMIMIITTTTRMHATCVTRLARPSAANRKTDSWMCRIPECDNDDADAYDYDDANDYDDDAI